MKTKFLTTNIDVAAVAAFGGLTVMPMFPLFMEEHGIRYSVVAFVITLWGFMSLRQMDIELEKQLDEQTPLVLHKPKHRKNRRRLITAAIIVLMSGVMLFGAIKFIDATLVDTPECEQRIKLECIKDMPEPICPPQQQRVPCPLDTAREQGQLNKENTHE